jgi:hypothetical protein
MQRRTLAITFGAVALSLTACPSKKPQAVVTPSPSCAPSRNPDTGYKIEPSLACRRLEATSLRRPVHLPAISPGAACPITRRRNVRTEPGRYGVRFLPGPGPAYPLFALDFDRNGAVLERSNGPRVEGWWDMKTMWWIDPRERGEVLIRARRLDGTNPIVLNNGPPTGHELVSITTAGGTGNYSDENLLLTARDISNIINGWRNYPGATAIRTGGCYGFQVDGKTFSYTIVFKAVP